METGDYVTEFNGKRLASIGEQFRPPEHCRWILVSVDGTQTMGDFHARPCLVYDHEDDAGSTWHWCVWIPESEPLVCWRDQYPSADVLALVGRATDWCIAEAASESAEWEAA